MRSNNTDCRKVSTGGSRFKNPANTFPLCPGHRRTLHDSEFLLYLDNRYFQHIISKYNEQEREVDQQSTGTNKKDIDMRKNLLLVPAFAFAGLILTVNSAEAIVVDCASTTVSAAIASNPGVTEFTVNGSCTETETIFITVDDFTLNGDGDDSVTGCILIDGAQRARIEDLTVTGCANDSGIRLYNAATGALSNVISSDHQFSGIELRYDSFAEIRNSEILNNGECGVILLRGAVGHGVGNTLTDNAWGLCPIQHSTYTSEGAVISDVGGGPAIDLADNSYLDMRGVDAEGDVSVALQSQLRVRKFSGTQSSIMGNIEVNSLSLLNILDASEITGNILATDISIVRLADTASVNGNIKCERKSSIC